MKKHLSFLLALAGLSLVALSTLARAEIPDIDTSKWAVDPRKYGMSPREYIQSECNAVFNNFYERAGGINKFFHFKGLTQPADHWVVSPNNDTIYSVATVDAREGFTVTVPDVGQRFLSIHIQDFNHTIVDYTWSSGTHHYPADAIDTDYVLVGIRTATDGSEEDQAGRHFPPEGRTAAHHGASACLNPVYVDPARLAGSSHPPGAVGDRWRS